MQNIFWATTRIGVFIALTINAYILSAQDPIYSQHYHTQVNVNPAFTGASYGPSFGVIHRNQWPGISNTYSTFTFTYDQNLSEKNSGVGFIVGSDDSGGGTIKTLNLSGLYSYRIQYQDDHFIKLGLEAGFINTRLDWQKLFFSDQLDPQFGLNTPGGTVIMSEEVQPNGLSVFNLDVSTGILIYTPNYYLGLSAKHINSPENSFFSNPENNSIGIPIRYSLHAGYKLKIREGNKLQFPTFLSPSLLFLKQGAFSQLNVGAILDFGVLSTGLHYRLSGSTGDAVIGMLGVKYKYYKFAYSFDYTTSNLGIGTGGSHEIGVFMNLDHLYDRPSKYNDCLKVFR